MDGQRGGRRPQRSAQRAADGELISLGLGEAAGCRARMRGGERYLCPPCGVPFLTARGGSRTDHFVHPPGQPTGGYHALTVAHLEAQLRLYRWAQSLRFQSRLEQVIDGGVRRADLLIMLADGSQVAVEVQYSGLTVEG